MNNPGYTHERNVLGALIANWEPNTLTLYDFKDPIHCTVFRAISSLSDSTDLASVTNYLQDKEKLSNATEIVSSMVIEAPAVLRKTEVDILRGYSIRRREYKRRMDEATLLQDMSVPLESIPNCNLDGYVTNEDDIQTFSGCRDRIMHLYEHGHDKCTDLCIPGMDLKTEPGKLLGVLASPKSGKTTFLAWLVLRSKVPFVIFSPENAPIEEYATIIFHMLTGKPFHRGPSERMTQQEVDDCIKFCEQRIMFLNVAPKDRYIDTILRKAELCVDKYGMRGLLIDPWNRLIENDDDKRLNKTDFIGRCLDAFEYFGQRKNVYTWYAMHPRKLQKNKDDEYPVPTLWDADGSAHHYNKLSTGLVLHRHNDEAAREAGLVDVMCAVSRWRKLGEEQEVTLRYDKYQAEYYQA